MLQEILKFQASKIAKQYKISEGEVLERLQLAVKDKGIQNERSRKFKKLIKKVKKDIYYDLRTYQRKEGHQSVLEREAHLENFFSQISPELSNAKIIVDIGGGMFPAIFPFDKYLNIEKYIWIDKDKKSFEKLQKLNNPKIELYNHKIGEKSWEHYSNSFDLALMLKLIPVVSRQEKHLLPILAQIPAKKIIITGSKEALAKRASIERRERKVLKKFINLTGRDVIREFEIENEFGYIIS
ncbi:hypothetical protein ACFL13_01555 [Patescibacteria group bacterium]